MSETMSPTDWAKFYHQNLSSSADAAAASTSTGMIITSSNLSSPHGSAPSPSSNLISPSEAGRISKPRKRSRASRRTPTTLLNTDTNNFRALVQQFTGSPSSPLAATPPAQSFNFGLGAAGNNLHNPNPNPTASLMYSSPDYHLQNQPQYQSQGFMISMSNYVNNHAAFGDGFFQRLGGNPRPPPPEGSDGFLMGMMNTAFSPSSKAPSNSNENVGNGFMF